MRAFGRDLRRAVAVFITAAFVAVCAPPASAQLDQWGYWENGITESWWLSSKVFESEDAVNAVARWRGIGAAPGDDWAGDYFSGSATHGTYMRWSPSGGFVIARVDRCQALVMGIIYGRAEFTPGLVRFAPEFSKAAAHAHGGAHRAPAPAKDELRFVPVEWGGQRLLIDEGRMDEFGDYVAGLGRYNDNNDFIFLEYVEFFTRLGAHELAPNVLDASGDFGALAAARRRPPRVPPGYERFLKRPLEAAVAAVGRSRVARDYADEGLTGTATYGRARLTFVTLNVGREHGVGDRMRFRFVDPEEAGTVRVTRAGRRTSAAVVISSLDDPEAGLRRVRARPQAVVGDRLTTSRF